MEKIMEKKEWKEPELVVIVRCKPEESVLAACKANLRSCGNEAGSPTVEIAAS